MLLSRAAQLVLQEEVLKSLKEPAISLARANILRLLGRQKRQSVNDIAYFLGQTKASASQNVDALERAGFIRRKTDQEDRRCVWVSLSPRGKRLLKRAEECQNKMLERALAQFPKGMVAGLSHCMRSLALALLDHSKVQQQTCLQCCAYDSAGCVHHSGDWHCMYMIRRAKSSAR